MDQNICIPGKNNIHVSKIVFNKFKKLYQDSSLDERHTEDIPLKDICGPILNFHPEISSGKFKTDEADIENKQLFANRSLQKRKSEENEKNENEFQNTFTPKFRKISNSSYLKEEIYWEQYASLKPNTIKSYSSLLPSLYKNNLLPESLSFSKSASSISLLKHIDKGKANATHIEEIFTTTAGKNINISNNAMLAGQRLIQSVFQDETHKEIHRDINCISVENKHFTKVPALKNSSIITSPTRNYKDDKTTTGERDSKIINNNHELSVDYDTDCVSFSTAAGKAIDVSEAAIKAAHKLIQDAFENEDKIIPSTSGTNNTCRKKSAFKNIGCPFKKLIDDDDIEDKALLEKLFQDVAFFDEKESQYTTESSKDTDIDKALDSKTSNYSTTRKTRKSLGGRRSMRFYSHT